MILTSKKQKKIGLKLVRRLSEQLYGNITYLNNAGAQFTISFKDTENRKTNG